MVISSKKGQRREMRLAYLVLTVFVFLSVVNASAQGTLIPVTDRRDHVYDPSRGLLYITTTRGTVERYDVVSKTLLTPFAVGNSLNGADITPDGSALYVTENQRGVTKGFVRKVNLDDGTVMNIAYPLDFYEGGAWDVGIGAYGKGLVSTCFEGSGWVPFRQLDLASDTLSPRADTPGSGFGGEVRQNTLITRGADRSLFFMTESNISSGPIFTYDPATDTFPRSAETNISLSNSLSSVNRTGTIIGLEIAGGISLFDTNFSEVENIGVLNGGCIFDPATDRLYAVDSSLDQVVAVDTATWKELYRIPIGENVGTPTAFGSGVISISDDGALLFLSTPSGIRMFTLPATTGPIAVNDVYDIGTQSSLVVDAAHGALANDHDPEGAPLTAVRTVSPSHGTLTLNSNGSFTYTPTSGFIGADTFTYQAYNGSLY
jgi:DNA-binding beta-propeller fold protein YncE